MPKIPVVADENTTAYVTRFDHKEYDTTNLCEKFCPPGSLCMLFSLQQKLILEPEEAVLVTSTICSTTNQRRPYGELGSVDKYTSFGICASIVYGQSYLTPGFGCSTELVEEIVAELKARMKARGDTGQIQRAETMLEELKEVQHDVEAMNSKIDAILAHLKITPPASASMAR